MANACIADDRAWILRADDFHVLLDKLRSCGYEVIGPTVRDGIVTLEPISTVDDLPKGVKDIQAPGRYRLEPREDDRWFGYSQCVTTAKRWLYPPKRQIWRATRTSIEEDHEPTPRLALIGLRACDLKSIEILDQVLGDRLHRDPDYVARRDNALLVAVTCSAPSALCFCDSMDSGPLERGGCDLSLTELLDEGGHRFLLQACSAEGANILLELPLVPASREDILAMQQEAARVRHDIVNSIETEGLKDGLYERAESARWEEVAKRCLGCGNCTLSCPTCFCATYDDVSALDGSTSTRSRVWDSCFHADFSYLHGGSVRHSTASRYRQWLTHKLASWHDQFGVSGCVGCGRCIAWCPVGIDITEEARAILAPAPELEPCNP